MLPWGVTLAGLVNVLRWKGVLTQIGGLEEITPLKETAAKGGEQGCRLRRGEATPANCRPAYGHTVWGGCQTH